MSDKCFYNGAEYSEGSLICVNNRELKCRGGEWCETGYSCEGTKIPKYEAAKMHGEPVQDLVESGETRVYILGNKHDLIVIQYLGNELFYDKIRDGFFSEDDIRIGKNCVAVRSGNNNDLMNLYGWDSSLNRILCRDWPHDDTMDWIDCSVDSFCVKYGHQRDLKMRYCFYQNGKNSSGKPEWWRSDNWRGRPGMPYCYDTKYLMPPQNPKTGRPTYPICTDFHILNENGIVTAEIHASQSLIELEQKADASCDINICHEITGTEENLIKCDKDEGCVGEWTQCISTIRSHPYQMTIVNALSLEHGDKLAQKCRPDVIRTTYYSSSILICAPYLRCELSS